MPGSSLRNAVKRITHKERSQPQARSHLGILEKKQDYKKRAKNYHSKEERIQAMQRKASMKNPDEFYFGMHNAQVQDGRHKQTEQAMQKELEDRIGADAVRVMKDQDLSYVRMQKQRDTKKAQRLKESLHLIGANATPDTATARKQAKHTLFLDSKEKADNFDAAEHFDTAPELVDRAFNRPRKSKLRAAALEQMGYGKDGELEHDHEQPTEAALKRQAKVARKASRSAARAKSSAYGELESRSRRIAAMEVAEQHLVTEKLVSGKGRKRKIKAAEDGRPAQYKWRRKRNR
jgi:U3 small nucleolar RNA-associated protein 11